LPDLLCSEDSGSFPAPAAALPPIEDEDDALPPDAAEPPEEFALGQEHEAEGVLTEPLTDLSPTRPCTFVCSGQVHEADGSDEDAEPPAEDDPPAAALPLTLELPDSEVGEELELEALEPEAAEGCELPEDELELPPVADDWFTPVLCPMVEDEPMSVEDWFAETPLEVELLPLPTFTPGLMFAPALMSVLLMPTFAPTPTFGLTFTPLLLDEDEGELPPEAALGELEPVCDDWLDCAPWFIDEDEFTSVDDWLADTLEFVVLLPLPMFTPGLMFAPALTSVLLMPTLASTPTFGLTFTLG
jgi:hypothetical protein